MPTGCFCVYRNPDDKWDITFSLKDSNPTEIPKNQLTLFSEAERLNVILRAIFKNNESEYIKYSTRLLTLSQAGLVGENAQPDLGIEALEVLKNDIVNNVGPEVKNKYMIKLGKVALIFLIVCFIIGIVLMLTPVSYLNHYCIIWAGSMIGLWISFGVRKMEFSLDDFEKIEKDQMTPIIRVVFVGISSLILALMMNTGMLRVIIGDFDSVLISKNYECSLLIGIFSGLAETSLSKNLYNKAMELIKI